MWVSGSDVAWVLKLGGKGRWLVSLSLSPRGKNSWLNFGKAWADLDECHLKWNSCLPTHGHKLYGTDATEGSPVDPLPLSYTYPFSCYISLSSLLLCFFYRCFETSSVRESPGRHGALCETLRENYFCCIIRLSNNITSGKCDVIYTYRVWRHTCIWDHEKNVKFKTFYLITSSSLCTGNRSQLVNFTGGTPRSNPRNTTLVFRGSIAWEPLVSAVCSQAFW
jgi:hypothetical protein